MGLSVWTKTRLSTFVMCIGFLFMKCWVDPFTCTVMNAEEDDDSGICKTEKSWRICPDPLLNVSAAVIFSFLWLVPWKLVRDRVKGDVPSFYRLLWSCNMTATNCWFDWRKNVIAIKWTNSSTSYDNEGNNKLTFSQQYGSIKIIIKFYFSTVKNSITYHCWQ